MDPVRLRIVGSLLDSIAEDMGIALERAGISPNIKERLDHSCALFDGNGELVAQAAHIPVHLGAMPMAVKAAQKHVDFAEGDVVLVNDPALGGTHLPDITAIQAFRLHPGDPEPIAYVANRAHHADVGGIVPGSMGLTEHLKDEGVVIPPTVWIRGGKPDQAVEDRIVEAMRFPEERRGDLLAQKASLQRGISGLQRLLDRLGPEELLTGFAELQNAAERHVRTLIDSIPDGRYMALEQLDGDGFSDDPILIRLTIDVTGDSARFDFSGTSEACRGPMNCSTPVTHSAIQYVLRCLAPAEIPASGGTLRPIEIEIPAGSLLDPPPGKPVAGGNVETSQRLVDVILTALTPALPDRIPAQSQGTMNNVVFSCEEGTHYETLAGGCGAGPQRSGASALQVHMTNTLNTPIERLEQVLPLRIRSYRLRHGSGGDGVHRGGEGIIREFEFLADMDVSILTERRDLAPSGSGGGNPGSAGRNLRLTSSGEEALPAKWQGRFHPGERLRIETPGGGGWGALQED
ncbi:MAG: hydantoinase B/oxoprolinase family protein [Planctomycetes bacterium]|nr:hydantoinase B/oxoprolinase family protein [Planctomycetota bacterium]